MAGEPLDSVVVVTGASGAGVSGLRQWLTSSPEFSDVRIVDFEERLSDKLGGMHVERIAYHLMSSSRQALLSKFNEALEEIVEEARGGSLAVTLHASYVTKSVVVLNPALLRLPALARRTTIVYLVEDYYDAVRRIAEDHLARSNLRRLKTPGYDIDPYTYLYWRGTEFTALTALKSMYPDRLRVYVFGAKHPLETYRRLFAMLLKGERGRTVYLSHPITLPRILSSLAGAPLHANPMVQAVSKIRDILLGLRGVIVFEPTTIDELITVPAERALEACGLQRAGGLVPDECIPRSPQASGEVLTPVIDGELRWPLPEGLPPWLRYPYAQPGGSLNMATDLAMVSLMDGFLRQLCLNYACNGRASYLADRLRSIITAQIEARDYAYVEQSSVIVLVAFAVYKTRLQDGRVELDTGIYIAPGAEAEVRRAHALGKRLIVALVPMPLERIASSLCRGDQGGCRDRVASSLASEAQGRITVSARIPADIERLGHTGRLALALKQEVPRLLGGGGEENPLVEDFIGMLVEELANEVKDLVWASKTGRPLGLLEGAEAIVVAEDEEETRNVLGHLLEVDA